MHNDASGAQTQDLDRPQGVDTTQALGAEIPGTRHELAAPAVEGPIPFPNGRERCSMSMPEFLTFVVAPGNYFVITYKFPDRGMGTRFFPRTAAGIGSAVGFARYIAGKGADVWFAVASYREATPYKTKKGHFQGSRKQDNTEQLKCLWFDADIHRPGDGKAPGKAFADKAEFETWLAAFCAATGLPRPNLIVNSGYGRHTYWILEDALSREDWEPYAEAFKAALIANGAKGDVGITTDSARILRLPGTSNLKVPDDPKTIEVTEAHGEIPNEPVYEKLQPFMGAAKQHAPSHYSNNDPTPTPIPGKPPALAEAHKSSLTAAARAGIPPGRTHSFKRIAEQCPQVNQSLAVGGADDGSGGDLWYLGHIRLASFCDDGANYAHEISKAHPEYDPSKTDARFKRAINETQSKNLGAPRCDHYNKARPDVCPSCPHWGNIKSPISLGVEEDTPAVPLGSGSPFQANIPTGLTTSANRLVLKNISYDPKNLKRIPWLVTGLLLRNRCSLIVGLTGASKTTFAMYIATALAAGFNTIGPFKVYRPREEGFRVLYISAEEDENEISLLSSATASVMNLTPAERQRAQNNLLIHDACDSEWAIGRPRPDKREDFAPESEDAGLAQLRTALDGYRFDLVIIDTAASMFKIRSELDNNALTAMVRRLDRVMKQYDCACLILHHTPKITREQAASLRGEVALSRGGGGLPFATRATYNMTMPQEAEAAQFITSGIDPTAIRRLDAARVSAVKEPPATLMEVVSVQVMTNDGTTESVRAVRFNAQITAAVAAGSMITDAARNVVMVAVRDGTRDSHGAKVPLSPGAGKKNERAAKPVIAAALKNAYPELTETQAERLAGDILKDLLKSGCVVEKPLPIPKYKPGGQLNGHPNGQGFECRWELAPWMKPEGAVGHSTNDSNGETAT
jgi:KaiC/GvpD/RAD55 family RecA-like ATPase